MVRTRFAPSPTGYLHIGGARTALFSWAYAKKHGGKFILRIEDTDLERSTESSVQAILDAMRWLGLDWNEGPFFQMQRLGRYKEVGEKLIAQGKAYRCWASKEDLDAMRERQRSRGEKPRYDGRWRPERAKAAGLVPPADRAPVVRFRNPDDGDVVFHDLVKGAITVANAELDDLVLLRADGERLSKRHGAVSVMQYQEDGYLPEALVNYLARLGWSHGDEEMFTVTQFLQWVDLAHISRSAAQFNLEKLRWLNHQYLRLRPDADLAELVAPRIERAGGKLAGGPELPAVVALLKERSETLAVLAGEAMMFYAEPGVARESVTAEVRPALAEVTAAFSAVGDWRAESIMSVIQAVIDKHKLKLPKLAMPLRMIVFGRAQTPNLGPMLALAGRKRVLERLQAHLSA